jgi:hypothetical protein
MTPTSPSKSEGFTENYLKALTEAIYNSIDAGSTQQLADAAGAMLSVKIQQKINTYWLAKVQAAGNKVSDLANQLAKNPNDKKLQQELVAAQADYQNQQTQMQTFAQQADSATQAMQNQTSQDSLTMQQRLQLMGPINQLLQALSNALSK